MFLTGKFHQKIIFFFIIAAAIHIIILLISGNIKIGGAGEGLQNLRKIRSIDIFAVEDNISQVWKKSAGKKSVKYDPVKTKRLNTALPPVTNANLTAPVLLLTNRQSTGIAPADTLTDSSPSNIQAPEISAQTGAIPDSSNLAVNYTLPDGNVVSNEIFTDMQISNRETNTAESGYLLFNIGEKIFYNVEVQVEELPYLKGTVGTVEVGVKEITNIRNRPVFHCTADVRSLDSIINLYVLRDFFETWFDAEFLQTYRIEKNVREGGWLDYITNYFYSDEGYGIVHSKSTGPDGNRYDMMSHSYDIITLLFFLRITEKNKPIEINWVADFGQKKKLVIEFSDGNDLELDLQGKKEKIKTIVAREKDTGITVYLAKDYDNLPVRAVIPAFHIAGYTINLNAIFSKYFTGLKTVKNW